MTYSYAAPAQPPEDVTVDVQNAHTLNVSWIPPTSQQNGMIRSYSVNITMADTGLLHGYISNTTSILIGELVPYSVYFIEVAAVTVATGPYSEIIYAATPEAGKFIATIHVQ